MLKWIFISIGFLLIVSLAAVYFHYRNKHAKNPLDELKKGLGNGTIDKNQYFDVQGQLTLHKADMERQGKFFNDDGYAINVPESIPEEASESDETESTDKSETPESAANHEKEPKA